jgi:hypothetical protein
MTLALKKQVVIVSPALADANNGNWQTARRWQKLLQAQAGDGVTFSARIVTQWPDGPAAAQDDGMLALHARKSASSIAAWAQGRGWAMGMQPFPVPGLCVVLTGTDLYRDIQTDTLAQLSLQLAQRLVVLQDLGLQALPEVLRSRSQVIFQSTSARVTLRKSPRFVRAVMVGHLREEKSPQTLFAAARLIQQQEQIRIDHIGAPLDGGLAALARDTAAACPIYRWLGGLPHEATPPTHPASPCAVACQPHGRRRACGDGGGVLRHAGAGFTHCGQCWHAGRKLCGLL